MPHPDAQQERCSVGETDTPDRLWSCKDIDFFCLRFFLCFLLAHPPASSLLPPASLRPCLLLLFFPPPASPPSFLLPGSGSSISNSSLLCPHASSMWGQRIPCLFCPLPSRPLDLKLQPHIHVPTRVPPFLPWPSDQTRPLAISIFSCNQSNVRCSTICSSQDMETT